MTLWLGDIEEDSVVTLPFSTHEAAGGNVAPSSALEIADIRVYKWSSATQRSSTAGMTMTSPFDSLTGVHMVEIDTSDNTDAGFWAAGNLYHILLAPDETVDGQTLTGVHLASFGIVYGAAAKQNTNIALILSRIGTPSNLGSGATVAGNLVDIEAQTDGIGAAGAGLTALGDARLANLDATITSRHASGAAVAKSPATIAAGDIATDAITAAAVKADAVSKIQAGLSTYAGGDTAGTTTLLSRLTATRAGYLDNLSAGAVALASSMSTLLSRIVGTLAAGTHEAQSGDAYARLGAAGASLTGIPWNAAWDAEVQSEAQDAITASALATAAELAKVPKSDGTASWNATALAAINAEVDTALNTAIPGSPTANSVNERVATMDGLLLGTVAAGTHNPQSGDAYALIGAAGAGLTALASQTSVNDLPTNTELATALGTADDAVLAAIADVPTVAEFEARTLPTASYFDPATDTVARVTLVDTTTTNTDMRGTDSAYTGTPPTAATIASQVRTELTTELGRIDATVSSRTKPADTQARVTLVDTTTTNTDMVAAAPTLAQFATVDTGETVAAAGSVAKLAQGAAGGDVTLAASQPNYAPAKAGAQMDLVPAPNATAVLAIQSGLSTFNASDDNVALGIDTILGIKAGLSTLTEQKARDAMKLAPTAGAPAADSIDDQLARIATGGGGLTAQQTADAVYNLAPAGSPAAGSLGAQVEAILEDTNITLPAAISFITGSVAASSSDATAAGAITRRRGDSWSIALTIGAITGYTSLWFTAKRDRDDDDTASVVQIKLNSPSAADGLLYVNGAAQTGAALALGSITVTNAATGEIVIALDETVTATIAPAGISYDVQVLNAGNVTTPDSGTLTITADVTRDVT